MVVPTSSRLVNVTEDAELRMVSLLGEYSSSLNVAQCEACISGGDASKLLEVFLGDTGSIPAFVVMNDMEEAVGCFSLLVALVDRASKDGKPQPQSTSAAALSIAETVSKSGDTSEATCDRKIRLLSVLYNMRSNGSDKVAILRLMMRVAGNHPSVFLRPEDPLGKLLTEQVTSSIQPTIPRVVTLLDSWKTPDEERRALYETIAEAMPADDIRKQRFLLLVVASASSSSSSSSSVREVVKQAALGAIKDPISLFAHQRNIMNQPAVRALEKDEKVLFGLLQVFQEGKLSDYNSFMAANGGEQAVLSKWGLSVEQCQRNIRILSLCSLAAEHEEIPYQSIAETLQIDPSQVEAQVIAAVSSGLLEAKMDQLQHKVLVERFVVRKFDVEQWKALQTRLKAWTSNVGSILTAIQDSKMAAAT